MPLPISAVYERFADSLGSVQRQIARSIRWGVNAAQSAPSQAANRDRGGMGPGQRGAVHEDAEGQPPAFEGESQARELGLQLAGQTFACGIVGDQIERAFLIYGIDVHELHFLEISGQAREDSRPHQPEFLGTGDQNAHLRIRARLRGSQCGDDSGTVVSSAQGASFEAASAGQEPRDEGQGRAEGKPGRRKGSRKPEESKQGEHGNGDAYHPYCHQPTGHRLALGLGVQMRNDPAPWGRAASSDQVRVFARGLSERDPSQADPSCDNSQCEKAGEPKRQRSPGREMGGCEEREQDQSESAQSGTEDGKGSKTGRREAELLDLDLVTQGGQVSGHELPSPCGFGSAGFSRKGEYLAGCLIQRYHVTGLPVQDAARFTRLVVANPVPAAARAARLVSSVI